MSDPAWEGVHRTQQRMIALLEEHVAHLKRVVIKLGVICFAFAGIIIALVIQS